MKAGKHIYKLMFISLAYGCLVSCTMKENKIVREAGVSYEVVNEDIYTSIPGSLHYGGGFLVWDDPRAEEGFVHIIDVADGSEVAQWGSIGAGAGRTDRCRCIIWLSSLHSSDRPQYTKASHSDNRAGRK